MTKAFVLMTAMPPTNGHLRLIQFASALADHVEVILSTQPGEPFIEERRYSVVDAAQMRHSSRLQNVHFSFHHKTMPQEPEGHEGFWDLWKEILETFGFRPGDYIVASERYGKKLAEEAGGIFWPFDLDRELYPAKATHVRYDPLRKWDWILPEFQKYLRKTVTIFGAESTGKTTLARNLASTWFSTQQLENKVDWIFEYARPYLEEVRNEITTDTMHDIWRGQKALQDFAQLSSDKPFIVQDTDLFSTVGYWELSPWSISGKEHVPAKLIEDALFRKSDLYVVLTSCIPYEADPLRYGGDHREIDDDKWIDLCERYGLNYIVADNPNDATRLFNTADAMLELFDDTAHVLADYKREGAEYQ